MRGWLLALLLVGCEEPPAAPDAAVADAGALDVGGTDSPADAGLEAIDSRPDAWPWARWYCQCSDLSYFTECFRNAPCTEEHQRLVCPCVGVDAAVGPCLPCEP